MKWRLKVMGLFEFFYGGTRGLPRVAQVVMNLSAKQATWVQSLDREDPRREWQPTPVFLPGESHGQRSLVGYSPWGSQRVGHDGTTNTHTHTHTQREGA